MVDHDKNRRFQATQAWEGAAEGQRMTVMDVEVTGKKMKGKKDEGGTRVVMVAVIR